MWDEDGYVGLSMLTRKVKAVVFVFVGYDPFDREANASLTGLKQVNFSIRSNFRS